MRAPQPQRYRFLRVSVLLIRLKPDPLSLNHPNQRLRNIDRPTSVVTPQPIASAALRNGEVGDLVVADGGGGSAPPEVSVFFSIESKDGEKGEREREREKETYSERKP